MSGGKESIYQRANNRDKTHDATATYGFVKERKARTIQDKHIPVIEIEDEYTLIEEDNTCNL